MIHLRQGTKSVVVAGDVLFHATSGASGQSGEREEDDVMSDPRTPPPSDRPSNAPAGEHRADSGSGSGQEYSTSQPTPTGASSATDRDGDGVRDDQERTTALPATDSDRDGIPDRDERRTSDPGTVAAAPVAVSDHRHAQEIRREEFGGFNVGADFFGWLVAVALTVLFTSIVGAVAAAVGQSLNVDRTDAQRDANSFGLATAIALLVILMLAYYAGGYVAGRMSRFDGGRQGVGVWLIGLLITLIAVGLGVLFGNQYNILDRVDLPSIPIPDNTLTSGGLITLAAVLVGTLLAAFAGGKVGQRYHTKIDRVGLRSDQY